MTHPNKRKGNNYENRFIKKMLDLGAERAIRHYGSIGVTDVEWTDKHGQKHEAQLKFSSAKPRITTAEVGRLYEYAKSKKDTLVWLVMKTAYKPEIWKKMN